MAELTLADRMHVSHSHLRGGPAVWTPEDVEKALALQVHEATRCTGCGTRPEDWKDGRRPLEAYAFRCSACEEIESLQAAATKDAGPHELHGIRFGLRVPEDAEP